VSDRNGSHGLQIFDLKRLRGASHGQKFTPDRTYRGIKNAHNIAIHDRYVYVVGALKMDGLDSRTLANGGLHILDVRNPLRPVPVGAYRKDGYIHDTQVVKYKGPDRKWSGKTIAFNSAADSFSIVSLESKKKPFRISASAYADAGFIHQGWLSEDHRFFFANDSKDEINAEGKNKPRMRIWDVRRLKRPRYLGFYEGNEASVDHNLYVKDDLIYQANYSSGLRVVRMQESGGKDSSLQLEEVAYIDTYPQRKNAEIQAGAWSAYPYFDDKLIVGDTLNGLFVAKLSFPTV
jgi:choice-of-anchor B domain-containing protein